LKKVLSVISTILLVLSYSLNIVGVLIVRGLFDSLPESPPEDLSFTQQVTVINDISYGKARKEKLDLYFPKEHSGSLPLIIWVHGGAFVGGDKRDVTYFAQALAYNGYAVAAINYERAPGHRYPTPVLQTGKAYTFLTESCNDAEQVIDKDKIFFAGDSAGAHIAAQFLILQTNEEYRANFLEANKVKDFPAPIPEEKLRGGLLFCGPYSVEKMMNVSNPLMRFLVTQTGWAYFNTRDFADLPVGVEANLVQHVTADFPTVFITDGNAMSFPEHGLELSAKLKGLGVTVQDLFFEDTETQVLHEYQFDLKTDAGRLALERTLEFLRGQLG